jgi:predicted RNA-binding Zn ribbon-like protein
MTDQGDSLLGPPAPLKYVGGDPALDLVNTIDWTATGTREDRLVSYERLVDWAEGAGVIPTDVGGRLRGQVMADPAKGVEVLAEARRTRRILRDAFLGLLRRDGTGLDALNELLAVTVPRLRVERWEGRARYAWAGWGEDPSCILWPVILSGADLLTSDEAPRIDMCPGEDCGWMFVDRSRNGLRKWCEMATCGTTAKNRRRREQAG